MRKKWGFEEFNRWADRELNINLTAYKEQQLQRRINTVMNKSGFDSLGEYAKGIETDDQVRQDFLDYITINVTDFFRNPAIFEEFKDLLKNDLYDRFGPLNIWSAACSIGSEPYSVAMVMDENRLDLKSKILATDIDRKILQRGMDGVYSEYELKNLPPTLKSKYFKKDGREYKIVPKMRNKIEFKEHDLLMDTYRKNFHVIICRNVIIYFKKEVKEELYQKFTDSLEPGGVLFTGATETIHRPEQYGLEKIGTFFYQKK